MDISAEIAAIQAASQGSELRQPLVGALNKLNSGSLPAVTASDAGKILKVGANGWEVGEKSGYMPVPSASLNISTNNTYDVTNYAEAVVDVQPSGKINITQNGTDIDVANYALADVAVSGAATLVQKTITQNGTYDPADDNADGYSEVIVSVGTPDTRTLIAEWDFKGSTPLIDKIGGKTLTNYQNGVTFGENGAYFAPTDTYSGYSSNKGLNINSVLDYGYDVELDVSTPWKAGGSVSSHGRLLGTGYGNGLVFRQSSYNYFAIYSGGWLVPDGPCGTSLLTCIDTPCTIKMSIRSSSNDSDYFYIGKNYKIQNTAADLLIASTGIAIGGGSSGAGIGGICFSSLRIYQR